MVFDQHIFQNVNTEVFFFFEKKKRLFKAFLPNQWNYMDKPVQVLLNEKERNMKKKGKDMNAPRYGGGESLL